MANLAWRVEVEAGLLEAVTLYNDFSVALKPARRFADSYQNVLGARLEAGPLLVYLDAAAGKNHPLFGDEYASALAEGEAAADWNVRLNANVGIYF